MKYFALLIILFSATIVLANPSCEDTHEPARPNKKGKIIYSLTGEQCVNKTNCYNNIQREVDRCLDDKTALRVFCNQDKPAGKKISCASKQKCRDGECI